MKRNAEEEKHNNRPAKKARQRKRKRGRARKTCEKLTAYISKEKVFTWNEASKKLQNKKECAKFAHE